MLLLGLVSFAMNGTSQNGGGYGIMGHMNNIAFQLKKVPSALTSRQIYRASVQSAGTVGHEELATLIAERTKQDVKLWKYFLDVLADEVDNQLLQGNCVRLGHLLLGFAIRGTFANEDDEFDPANHRLVTTVRLFDPLKSKMAAEVPENVTSRLSCVVSSAMDSVTKRTLEIAGTNRLLVQGKRLGISPDNPDEGVWLADQETGKVVATAIVERSDSQTIDCVFAEPPEPGEYALVVACRNGARASLSPAIARIKGFVVRGNS